MLLTVFTGFYRGEGGKTAEASAKEAYACNHSVLPSGNTVNRYIILNYIKLFFHGRNDIIFFISDGEIILRKMINVALYYFLRLCQDFFYGFFTA
jgi:hypothetical protein